MLKRRSIGAVITALTLLVAGNFQLAAYGAPSQLTVGGNRPVTVQLPSNVKTPAPLLILLHSAGSSGAKQEKQLKLAPVAKKMGMIFLAPDGTPGIDGRRVWNASKSCCQKTGVDVDDIVYIDALIEEIALNVPVDRSRIYFVGHSNGAFMSLTFACSTGKVARVVSLAGAMDQDFQCTSPNPFGLLHIHGAADATISIDGGVLNRGSYTSAIETLNRVAAINSCPIIQLAGLTVKKKDFDPTIPGAETTVQTLTGCASPITYWRIARGLHSPRLPSDYATQVLSFLAANSK